MKKTLVLKIDPKAPDKESIAKCAQIIKDGGIVAFPTETVYGLAANLSKEEAMERLYKVKARPRSKPFTVHISNIKMIKDMGGVLDEKSKALVEKFWPGPLTIIVKAKGSKKIGFRMPANKVALDLIKASGVPVVAPSANLSGGFAPTCAEDVLKDLDGKIDILLDAGPTTVGIESTVVDMTVSPPAILREGAIKDEAIFKVIGNG